MSEKNKMSKAPVYYALVQAQFNPIAAMAKYVDDIQDQLRQRGYILFERQEVPQLRLDKKPEVVEANISQAISWLIIKEDRTAGFILTASSLTLHTTHYDTKEKFIPELLHGLKIVHEVVKLDQISRLGLRYLNAVLPEAKESVNQYLVEGLHGIIGFEGEQNYSLSESVFQTDCGPLISKGTLIARVIQLNSVLGYPPDIAPNGLEPRFEVKEAIQHGVIDIDNFVQGRIPLDFDKIQDQLLSLHKTIKLAFEAMTTNYAKRTWL